MGRQRKIYRASRKQRQRKNRASEKGRKIMMAKDEGEERKKDRQRHRNGKR